MAPQPMVKACADAFAAKAKNGGVKTLLLSVVTGILIATAGAVTGTVACTLQTPSAARLASGLLFPFGLCMAILLGAELFTGNALLAVPVLARQITPWQLFKNWLIVYPGNFVGALLVAAGCAFGGQLAFGNGALAVHTIRVAAAKCAMPFGSALVLGIFCNILVCVAVVTASGASSTCGKAVCAYIPVAVFVLCGFEHSVANMFYIPAGLFAMGVPEYAALAQVAGLDTSALTAGGMLLGNLLPVTLGNIAGGLGFSAVMWACYLRKPAQ